MDLGIKGRVAVVAASSEGLGKAIAMELFREGAHVVINGRRRKILSIAEREIAKQAKGEILTVAGDVSTRAGTENLVRQAVKKFGRLDILVTNAGGPPAGKFKDINDEQWGTAVELTVMSVVRLVRAALPHMKRNRWGRIVNLTSMTVRQPSSDMVLSSALRAAVANLTKSLADELAGHNILVNSVAPGSFLTRRHEELIRKWASERGLSEKAMTTRLSADIPLRRVGRPEELANAVAFLCSEHASYITGTSLAVDGGVTRSV